MTNRFFKFLPIAAALLMAVSCSRDDDGNAPASGSDGVQTVATNANTAKPIQIPFSITVGGKPSSLTKAKVEERGYNLTQLFSEGDVLIITGEGLAKDNPSVLTITPEGIDQETATFTGNLNLASEGALESGAKLTATLSNEKLGNEGKQLGEPVLVSNLDEAFKKYGYLVTTFTYSDDDNPPQINLEQHTAFLVFDLPYTGEKVNVKIGDVTTPVFVSSKQVLAVPDGATVTSQRMSINLTIDLLFETPGEAVDVVFDIKRDLQLPDDCVPGLFSVSADKQVFFSKGNLQYNATPQEGESQWRFAPKQYSICHTNGDDVGEDYENWKEDDKYKWTDLFGWGMWLDKNPLTDANYTDNIDPLKTFNTSGKDYLSFEANGSKTVYQGDLNDLGRSAMGSDWTTFTNEELCYLISYKSSSLDNFTNDTRDGKYGWGSIELSKSETVYGMILLPDGWTTKPEGVETEFTPGMSSDYNKYSKDEWALMEKAGAVFLPAAGYRNGTDVSDVGDDGNYWSSSASGSDNAWYLYFESGVVEPEGGDERYWGQSVRLVRQAK